MVKSWAAVTDEELMQMNLFEPSQISFELV